MNNEWYKIVDSNVPITQGDIIFNCPLIGWQGESLEIDKVAEVEALKTAVVAIEADVVVLSQACDLENNKVLNIILCSHLSIKEYKQAWETEMKRRDQNPTSKSWGKHCDDICDGFIWNLAIINSFKVNPYEIDIRLVDFHEVFTVPRNFLESLLKGRNKPRFSLLPPYREHLSQAFARFFMRVGLPIAINKTW